MEKTARIREILDYYREQKDRSDQSVIGEMLRELQKIRGFLTPELKKAAAETAGVSEKLIDILVRRYPSLKETAFEHEILACTGERCGSREGAELIRRLRKELEIGKDDLSADGRVLLRTRCCLKRCRTAVNMDIDGVPYTGLTPGTGLELAKKICGKKEQKEKGEQ